MCEKDRVVVCLLSDSFWRIFFFMWKPLLKSVLAVPRPNNMNEIRGESRILYIINNRQKASYFNTFIFTFQQQNTQLQNIIIVKI